jgi:hypothetical protein
MLAAPASVQPICDRNSTRARCAPSCASCTRQPSTTRCCRKTKESLNGEETTADPTHGARAGETRSIGSADHQVVTVGRPKPGDAGFAGRSCGRTRRFGEDERTVDCQRSVADARTGKRCSDGEACRDGGARRGDAVQPGQAARARRCRPYATGRRRGASARSLGHGEHAHRGCRVPEGRCRRTAAGAQSNQRIARPGARRFRRARADHQPGRRGRRQPEFAEGGIARACAARGFHPPREDHPLTATSNATGR